MQGIRYTNPCFPVMAAQHSQKYAHSKEETTAILILDEQCSVRVNMYLKERGWVGIH